MEHHRTRPNWVQKGRPGHGNWAWVLQKNKKSEDIQLEKPLQIYKVDKSIVVNFHPTTVEIISNHRSFGTQKIFISYLTFMSFMGSLPMATRWLANACGYCAFLNQTDSLQFDPEEITRFVQRLGENIGIIGDIQAASGNYQGKYFSHIWLGETLTKSQIYYEVQYSPTDC